MADFPSSPSHGDTYTSGNLTFVYNSTKGVWDISTPLGIDISDLSDTNGLLSSNTDGLTEGTTNVYYTNARVQSHLGSFSGNILPDANDTYDIGSAEYKIRDLYVSDNSIHIGDKTLSRDNVDRSMEVFDELPPSSPTDIGNKGDVRIDSDYMYVCKDLNSWVRIPIDKTW